MSTCYYTALTAICQTSMMRYSHEAAMKTGLEAARLREFAQGVFIGWQALVEEVAEPSAYIQDCARLRSLLTH